MKEKTYADYSLDEKLIYSKGWNDAIKQAVIELRKLDKSVQAVDED